MNFASTPASAYLNFLRIFSTYHYVRISMEYKESGITLSSYNNGNPAGTSFHMFIHGKLPRKRRCSGKRCDRCCPSTISYKVNFRCHSEHDPITTIGLCTLLFQLSIHCRRICHGETVVIWRQGLRSVIYDGTLSQNPKENI